MREAPPSPILKARRVFLANKVGQRVGVAGPFGRRSGVAAQFLAVLALTAGGLVASSSSAAADQPSYSRVGHAPRVPPGATDTGAQPGGKVVHLSVMLSVPDPGALQQYAIGASTPGQANFRQFITPQEFAAQFGPSPDTIQQVRDWLTNQGFDLEPTSANGLDIPFTATISQLERAFATQIHGYRLADGRRAYANLAAPQVPTSLADSLQAIFGLDDLTQLHNNLSGGAQAVPTSAPLTNPPTTGPTYNSSICPNYASPPYTADQIASAYKLPSLYGEGLLGGGVTVGLFELEPFSSSDISTYQGCYGTNTPVTTTLVDGGSGSTGAGSGEAALDIEDVIGLAPTTNIDVYEGPNTTAGLIDTYNAMMSNDTVQVISTSWGLCDLDAATSTMDSENTIFEEAAAQGQTVLAAAGDTGAYDCGKGANYKSLSVDDPAGQPFVTSVGGTTMTRLGPPPTETVWNSTCSSGACAGGGGVSDMWPMPSWQSGTGVIESAYSSGTPCGAAAGSYCREVPDVTASADPNDGYLIYWNGGWIAIGGTSAATPTWASVIALIDNGCGAGTVGFANPRLYSTVGSTTTNDITSGNNGYYPAGTGYDMASGLGSPIATSTLLSDLCAPMVSGISPNTGPSTGGTSVTISGSGFTPQSTVKFGSNPAAGVTVSSSLQLTATAPPGAGAVDVTVTTASGTSPITAADLFTYTGPGITSITCNSSPCPGAAPGTVVTLNGSGFGTSPGHVTLTDAGIQWGGPSDAAQLSIGSWSNTQVTFTVPTPQGSSDQWQVIPGTTATVAVTMATGVASNAVSLLILSPGTLNVTSSPTSAPIGTSVTLSVASGSTPNFGSTQGAGYVTLDDSGIQWGAPNDAAPLSITSWGTDAVSFTVPTQSGPWAVIPGTTATVTVTNGSGAVSNVVQLPINPTGSLSISTSTSSLTAGQVVSLTGSGLGTPGWVTLTDEGVSWGAPNDAACLAVDSWTTGAVSFTVPSPTASWRLVAGTNATVSITNSAGYVSNVLTIPVATTGTPSITVSPTSAAVGTVVTLTASGGGLGTSQGTGYATLIDGSVSWGAPNDAAAFTVDSWSDTAVSFTVPSPSGPNGMYQVIPGTTATATVTSAAGAVSKVASISIVPAGSIPLFTPSPTSAPAGTAVTLTGSGFGANQGSGYVTFVDNGTEWGVPWEGSITIVSWSDTQIVFDVPSGVTLSTTATIAVTNAADFVSNQQTLSIT